ncbi:MAG: tyrosine-type recombinase/integrase [Bacteroidota bacterium]
MHKYKEYLQKLGYSKSSIAPTIRFVEYFLKWVETNNLMLKDVDYDIFLDFIDNAIRDFSERCNVVVTVNRILTAVSLYYDYLSIKSPNLVNQFRSLRIKNPRKHIISNLLTKKELLEIYYGFPKNTDRDKRNRVIFGLLIFQALTTGELKRLKIEDLNFENGTIKIESNPDSRLKKGNNCRTLLLEAKQIFDILYYMDIIRPRILANYYYKLPGRKPNELNTVLSTTNQLLLSMYGSPEINNSLLHLFHRIRKKFPSIRNAVQIRQSVIAYWITKYNLRVVQYMAGHRYVGSTERYKQVNINNLKREIMEFHPLD